MIVFFRRLLGALVLDAATYEDIEQDRGAVAQAVIVIVAVCAAGGVAALGLGLVGLSGFITGAIVMLGGWLIWVAAITTIGTIPLAEPQTRSSASELLRTLGYASAPGIFVALAAMRPAAGIVASIVVVWMIAAAVVAVRQALDYRSTARAAAVCTIAAVLSLCILAGIAVLFTQRVG